MLNIYTVFYRQDAGAEVDHTVVTAFRVEGWASDYAFFGHPGDLSAPTVLIPRDVVLEVNMESSEDESIAVYQGKYRRTQREMLEVADGRSEEAARIETLSDSVLEV